MVRCDESLHCVNWRHFNFDWTMLGLKTTHWESAQWIFLLEFHEPLFIATRFQQCGVTRPLSDLSQEKDLNFCSQTDTLSCVVLPLLYSKKHWQRSLQATSLLTWTLTGSSSRSSSSEGSLCSAGSTAHLFWSWRRFWCSLVRNWTRSGRSRWSSGDGETWEGSSDKKDRGRWFWAMPSCSCWPEWVQTEDSEAGPGSSMTRPPWWGWLNGCGALPARWKAMLFYIWPLGEGSHSSYHENVMTEGTQSAS